MHPAFRTLISLLIAASVTGAIAAIDFLRERLPGQTGLLDSPQAWTVLLPILTALLDAARRWLTDWQKRPNVAPKQALPPSRGEWHITTTMPDGMTTTQFVTEAGRDPVDDADLDVERSWRDVRREAKRKRRELRNQPDGVRQSALAVLIWPFLNAVIAWAIANIGPKIIEWLQKQLEKLRERFPQAAEWNDFDYFMNHFWLNVPSPQYEPRIVTGPAPKFDGLGITNVNAYIPPAPIPAPAPEGGDPSRGSTGDPDSMPRSGVWKNPPRTGE